jgi:predicted alpha/beta hydrolase family esterase
MPGPSEPLRVEVLGDEIIVILPATSYGVTYFKPANSPQLLAKDFHSKNDSSAPITHAEFIAKAWQAANEKARELGWIV